MLPILWRAEAKADFAVILQYIAERSPLSALHLFDDVERLYPTSHSIHICTELDGLLVRVK